MWKSNYANPRQTRNMGQRLINFLLDENSPVAAIVRLLIFGLVTGGTFVVGWEIVKWLKN